MTKFTYTPGPIDVGGAVFDDFRLTHHLPACEAPKVIERDRIHMSARPGFNRKLLPLRMEPYNNVTYSGGRYLIDTYENAEAFFDWVSNDFELDGVQILKRNHFAEVTGHLWRVVGAHDFKDIHGDQTVVRVERFSFRPTNAGDRVANAYATMRDDAETQGLSSLWLLYNDKLNEGAIVTVAGRVPGARREELDFASVAALEARRSLASSWIEDAWAERTFDRTSWVFTTWFHYDASVADNKAPLWPNSPALPAPTAVRTEAAE